MILEVPPDEHDHVAALDRVDPRSAAADLRVPLAVNLAFGPSWAEAKRVELRRG